MELYVVKLGSGSGSGPEHFTGSGRSGSGPDPKNLILAQP